MQEEIKKDVNLKYLDPVRNPEVGCRSERVFQYVIEKMGETKVQSSVYPKKTQIPNKWLEDTTMYMCCMIP